MLVRLSPAAGKELQKALPALLEDGRPGLLLDG